LLRDTQCLGKSSTVESFQRISLGFDDGRIVHEFYKGSILLREKFSDSQVVVQRQGLCMHCMLWKELGSNGHGGSKEKEMMDSRH